MLGSGEVAGGGGNVLTSLPTKLEMTFLSGIYGASADSLQDAATAVAVGRVSVAVWQNGASSLSEGAVQGGTTHRVSSCPEDVVGCGWGVAGPAQEGGDLCTMVRRVVCDVRADLA